MSGQHLKQLNQETECIRVLMERPLNLPRASEISLLEDIQHLNEKKSSIKAKTLRIAADAATLKLTLCIQYAKRQVLESLVQ